MAQSRARRSAARDAERALQRRSAAVCRRELDETLAALDAAGGLTPEQRAALHAFAKRLSHGVVADPLAALEEGEANPETAAALFQT